MEEMPEPPNQRAPDPAKSTKLAPPAETVVGRKRPIPPMLSASPDLLWQCMRESSSFLRKPNKEIRRPFSAEPCNLLALHAAKFSGLASEEALDVRPLKKPSKAMQIRLTQSHAEPSCHQKPSSTMIQR